MSDPILAYTFWSIQRTKHDNEIHVNSIIFTAFIHSTMTKTLPASEVHENCRKYLATFSLSSFLGGFNASG